MRFFAGDRGKPEGVQRSVHPEPLSKLQPSPAGCDCKHGMGRGIRALTPSNPIPNTGAEQKGLGQPSPSSLLPVAVVQVLPDQRMGLHRPVSIHFRHVQIIDEVHKLLGTRRAVISASLFIQRLLKHTCMEAEVQS